MLSDNITNIVRIMTRIRRVKNSEFQELSVLATEIVKDHFDPLIGKEQNDYMIALFQTPEAIKKQMENGYQYYWVIEDGDKAGFFAIFPKEGKMYLSKFYVHKAFRGRHLAKKMMTYIFNETRKQNLPAVFLNVNKGNTEPIHIYQHYGFKVIREEKNDIGNGFFMDDYVMECRLDAGEEE